MEPECKNKECFANIHGRCFALSEVDRLKKCSFFKTRSQVDNDTMRRLLPTPKKEHPEYGELTRCMHKTTFEAWFKEEWDSVTIPLLINHREEIAKINIALEL